MTLPFLKIEGFISYLANESSIFTKTFCHMTLVKIRYGVGVEILVYAKHIALK